MGIPSSLYLGLFWPLFIGKILRGGPCRVVFWIKLLTMSNLSHSSSFTYCCYFYFYYYDILWFVAFCLCYENTSSPSALMLFIVLLPFRSSVLSLSITSFLTHDWLSSHRVCTISEQHFAGRLWPRGRFTKSAKVWAPGLKRPEIWTSSGGSGAGNWPFWQCEVCDQNGTKHGNGGIASKCLLFFFGLNHVLISNNLTWFGMSSHHFFLLGGFMVLFTHSSRWFIHELNIFWMGWTQQDPTSVTDNWVIDT